MEDPLVKEIFKKCPASIKQKENNAHRRRQQSHRKDLYDEASDKVEVTWWMAGTL